MTDNALQLLRKIEEEAISDIPLSSVLRKCRVLAARLGLEDFEEWVRNELNGYQGSQTVPHYRMMRPQIYGTLIHPYGQQINNYPIPLRSFPESLRDLLSQITIKNSVSAIEHMCQDQQGDGIMKKIIPHDIAHLARVLEGFVCIEAWHLIPSTMFINAVEIVRNKTLEFILQIQKVFPESEMEGKVQADPVHRQQASNIFLTIVYGNAGNVGNITSSDAALTIQSPGAQTASGGNTTLGNHRTKDAPEPEDD